MVTFGEREERRGKIGVDCYGIVVMGLYEIMCVKLLKIVKHYGILKRKKGKRRLKRKNKIQATSHCELGLPCCPHCSAVHCVEP